jgi:hypothetical protein
MVKRRAPLRLGFVLVGTRVFSFPNLEDDDEDEHDSHI